MNLIADIGNSHSKIAFFKNNEMIDFAMDDFSLFQKKIKEHKPQRALISETGTDERLIEYIQMNMVHKMFHPDMKIPIQNNYETPLTLGHDRIAGAVAAAALFPHQEVLKIDFGSCNTYDIILPETGFHGGSISPGIQIRFKALNHFTKKLPLLDFNSIMPLNFTGKNTQHSLESGVLNGILLEVDGFINHYKSNFTNLNVVGTGGNAEWFASHLKNEIFVRPFLVLEGLNKILDLNA